jgi:hypothetical protein
VPPVRRRARIGWGDSRPHPRRGAGPGFESCYTCTADRTTWVVVVVVVVVFARLCMEQVEPMRVGSVKRVMWSLKPSPQNLFGGEGWVRGKCVSRQQPSMARIPIGILPHPQSIHAMPSGIAWIDLDPLTPALSPDEASGEREPQCSRVSAA